MGWFPCSLETEQGPSYWRGMGHDNLILEIARYWVGQKVSRLATRSMLPFLYEVPVLWPPDVQRQLTGKDPNAGKDLGQKEKGMTEDEMV